MHSRLPVNLTVLLLTCLILLTGMELLSRYYYNRSDTINAWDEADYCSQMYYKVFEGKSPEVGFGPESRITYDPVLGYTNRPGYVVKRQEGSSHQPAKEITAWENQSGEEFFYHVNPQGIRSMRPTVKERVAKERIALMGDSFTFGAGEPTRHIFSELLPYVFPGSDALNLGVEGYSFSQMYLRFATEAVEYSPTIAVFSIYIDDIRRSAELCGSGWLRPQLSFERNSSKVNPVPDPDSIINTYAQKKYKSYFLTFIYRSFALWNLQTKQYNEGFAESAALLDLLKASAKKQDIKLFFAIIEGKGPSEFEKKQAVRLENLLREKNIPYLHLDREFQNLKKRYNYNGSMYTNHLNRQGHAFFANALAKRITSAYGIPFTDEYIKVYIRKDTVYLVFPNGTISYMSDVDPVAREQIPQIVETLNMTILMDPVEE